VTTQLSRPDPVLRNIEFTRKFQVFGTWCGPGFVLLLFGGWGILGGLIPLLPPSNDAGQIAAAYSNSPVVHLIGLSLAMAGTCVLLPFYLTVSMQMRRTELRWPYLSILQLISGVVVVVVLLIPIMFFIVAQFRTDRPDDITQLMNDMSYICLILPWPPLFGQLIPLALAVFNDHRTNPVFPRWLGYFNLWTAVFLLPANLLIFFKTGPFAWNGIFGFWIPAAVFGLWYLVMSRVMLKAIQGEAEEQRALAQAE
jgi:hypothetical protein